MKTTLKKYIDQNYKGNMAAFGRDYGIARQNVRPLVEDTAVSAIGGKVVRRIDGEVVTTVKKGRRVALISAVDVTPCDAMEYHKVIYRKLATDKIGVAQE